MAFFTWLLTMDGRLFNTVTRVWQNPFFDLIMPFLTRLGAGGLIWLFVAFALAVCGRGKGRKAAFLAMVALLLGWFFCDEVLKTLVARPRPFLHWTNVRILADKPLQYSFPSGHTTTSFAPATVLFRKSKGIGVAALILAALIGFSRIYVGVHYPSDVAGGVVLGSLIGWLVVRYEQVLDRVIIRGKRVLAHKR
ncbi:Phosphatidic acid phosphatase type 2/haloperoxidase [Acididesulfobacillus acetoxydans]|uniref:Phosphatidic acid phosphatase type 2/haloperoxidase n=1 Tax=Acididesulfobacillus acetoxydans TaxID=1561005 RepID=A0A8S0XBA4_9FIRM|nr:phosphatase PAP2 family protein [Acididesulfobacillus acetoxydans]CAA7600976.1 Phosphatidic acid phosphatase type 2/haloperoxidase [Acididesulfobacillus acetoxydans]CEJ07699.1 Phosphatidic acid phosphatase type 2/haloperoxidase [Acididesulfobacillus acetoxydans]